MKNLVYKADTASFDSPEYDSIMIKATKAFIDHAEEEENEQLDKIKSKLTPEQNDVSPLSLPGYFSILFPRRCLWHYVGHWSLVGMHIRGARHIHIYRHACNALETHPTCLIMR